MLKSTSLITGLCTLLAVVNPTTAFSLPLRASYYDDWYHGRPTASGELYDKTKYTAAACHYRYGTRLKVTNILNNRQVIVRVNDTGGFCTMYPDRALDLSRAAMTQLGGIQQGVIPVRITPMP